MTMNAKRADKYPLRRRSVVAELLKGRDDLLVVAGLGASAWDCTAAGDRDLTFPLWGGMGGAASIGLGLALAQPKRRVLVITGDGEMLMGMGSLATVAAQSPGNLAIVVLDNERYGETGGQMTHTAGAADLAAIAKGAGIPSAGIVRNAAQFKRRLAGLFKKAGPSFTVVKVRAENLPLVLPPKDGTELRTRFRKALGV
jgi:thiamine pyrophosphate-dependent acetolactate synthase large subunit-like protein